MPSDAVAGLHFDELGEAGPPLILLHPVGLDNKFWGALPKAAARTHRVLAVDLLGHGKSPAARKFRSVADYAEDVHAILASVRRHGPAVVLGLSFGGMIAQELALHHPQDVSGLILCGSRGQIPPEARESIRERGLAAERGGMSAVVPSTLERWFTPAFLPDPAVDRVRQRLLATTVEGFSAAWHAIAGFDALERLKDVRCPAMVIAGERDAASTSAASAALAEAIPEAELKVLAGAPHMMQIENADAFCDTVVAYLTSLSGDG